MYRLSKPLIALLVPVMLACLPGSAVAQEKPNIVLVFLDNFGWGELGSMVVGFCVAVQCQPHRLSTCRIHL